jgi:hypothetical protein
MRILVVEDERRMAELLSRTFEEEGHQVILARDGREGLEINTPVGRLESEPAGVGRIFRLTLQERYRRARFFYYSDGRLRVLVP